MFSVRWEMIIVYYRGEFHDSNSSALGQAVSRRSVTAEIRV